MITMTNGEKFKTAEERTVAFLKFCAGKICKGIKANCVLSDKIHDKIHHRCEFAWLELEYKEELKPCPFCGEKARIVGFTKGYSNYTSVECEKCFCRTIGLYSNGEAIAAWNRRVK